MDLNEDVLKHLPKEARMILRFWEKEMKEKKQSYQEDKKNVQR